MIDIVTTTLNALVLVLLIFAFAVVALMVAIVFADVVWYVQTISMDFAWCRGQVSKGIVWCRAKKCRLKEAAKARETAKLQEDINKLKKISQAKLREEKEASAAHEELLWGFYDESYPRGFDRDGKLLYRGYTVAPEDVFDNYRKLDELADDLIYENTKEL